MATRNRWEALAREDAEFYIKTDLAPGEDFFSSGETDVRRILGLCSSSLMSHEAALEIGCGVGRLTLPMSRNFSRVIAVDVAPTMLRRLSENCVARGVPNVTPKLPDADWDAGGPVNFAYSRIVFQHIADWRVIEDYLHRIGRCLAHGGICYAQFDTRPQTPLYHFKNALPDAMLPRTWRRGVRRIRRTAAAIKTAAGSAGLHVVLEQGGGTFDTEFVFRKPDPSRHDRASITSR